MPVATNLQDALLTASSTVLTRLALFLPNLLGSLLIFIVGWIVSGWTRSVITKLLRLVNLHRLTEGTGVETFLKKAELKGKAEELLGGLVRWVVLFIFLIASINVLGLSTVSQVLNNILAYIPRAISAVIILVVGVLLSGVVESLVKGATGALEVATSRFLGKIASWIVMVFSTLAAISELGIAEQFITTLFIGVVTTLALGLGLSLGLGSKDIVRDILTSWVESVKKDLKRGSS